MILRNRDWKKKESRVSSALTRAPPFGLQNCLFSYPAVTMAPLFHAKYTSHLLSYITIRPGWHQTPLQPLQPLFQTHYQFYIGDQTPGDIKHGNYRCNNLNKVLRVEEDSLNSLRRSHSAPFTQEDSPPSLLRRSSSSEDPIIIIYPAAVFGSVQTSWIKISIQLITA